jgi:uncharacterized protein with PQ loop repeat
MLHILTIWATIIAPTLSSILITIAYLPQIIKTQRTKRVGDLSLGFWVLLSSFLVCMVSNALYLLITVHSIGYFITELINFALAIVVLVQILVFRGRLK